jgi:hypothetical protein
LVEADKETDEQNYLLWRIVNGVAEGSTEIPKGIFFTSYLSINPSITARSLSYCANILSFSNLNGKFFGLCSVSS